MRQRPAGKRDDYSAIPAAVEIVEGDLGDPAACQEAVRGVNKVRFIPCTKYYVVCGIVT